MIQRNSASSSAIINGGFESNPLEGWETAEVVESGGYESQQRLTHPGGNAPVESIQKSGDISNGWYRLKLRVRSSHKREPSSLQQCMRKSLIYCHCLTACLRSLHNR